LRLTYKREGRSLVLATIGRDLENLEGEARMEAALERRIGVGAIGGNASRDELLGLKVPLVKRRLVPIFCEMAVPNHEERIRG